MANSKSLSDPDAIKFSRMEQFIMDEYWRNISISEISAAGGVCRSKCFALFSTFTQKTPNDYLIDYRLKVAKDLLAGTMTSLAIICQECGFTSQSYFCTSFLKKFGQTPSAYRKENLYISKTKEEQSANFQKNLYEAVTALSYYFYKIIKIDLITDTYDLIKPDYTDKPHSLISKQKMSAWLNEFTQGNNLHQDDKDGFLKTINLSNTRNVFAKHTEGIDTYIRYKYRRLVGEDYKWVMMEILPCPDYTETNQKVFMYIRDIDRDMKDAQAMGAKLNS